MDHFININETISHIIYILFTLIRLKLFQSLQLNIDNH